MLILTALASSGAEVLYQNDFTKEEIGSVPKDFLIIEGQFAVKEENGNKFLELPGTPLDSFGLLFGPKAGENVSVHARIFGTAKGRRYPAFDVGLNGFGGYKLRVSPGKKQLELYRGDAVKTSVPFVWIPGKWTHLKLQLVKSGEAEWQIEGRAWPEGAAEPKEPSLRFKDTQAPLRERASVGAMPYSGDPVYFDDLVVSSVGR